jgi:hypothetical protein
MDPSKEELLRRLAVLEMNIIQERALTNAERARADEERARADEERVLKNAERARADAAEKATFVARLASISASGSYSPPLADFARRGGLEDEVVGVGAILAGVPELDDADVRAAWESFVAAHAAAPPAPSGGSVEINVVQPVVMAVARHAAGAAGALRVWRGKTAADDTIAAAMAPDQVWTHARDAAPTTIGALIIVEVKLPGAMDAAIKQAACYARRRVAALFHEADSRGEPGHDVFALAVATDGASLAVLRTSSGAPADAAFSNARPCPTSVTELLPLIEGWSADDATRVPTALPRDPPRGFAVLARLLRAPPAALGGGAPLAALAATLDGAAVMLRFASRLGSGGTSDVYAVDAAPGERFAGACVKVPRFTTSTVVAQFDAERRALADLARAEGVPRVAAAGEREGATAAAHRLRCVWPLLVLTPTGEPLCVYVSRLMAEQGAGADAAAAVQRVAAARRATADGVAADVLRALACAHALGIFHCDVRPANIVVAPPGAGAPRFLLVDWGLCARARADVAGRGVPAFAATATVEQGSCIVHARHDLAALAHTWLAVAHGSDTCAAPWAGSPLESAADTLARRTRWLACHSVEARAVAGLLLSARADVTTAAYAWPRP